MVKRLVDGLQLRVDDEMKERYSDIEYMAKDAGPSVALAVELATTQMQGPSEEVEFLARRLAVERAGRAKKEIVLGTPLYVALAG